MANKSVKGYAELYDSPEDIGAVHCALYCQLYSDVCRSVDCRHH